MGVPAPEHESSQRDVINGTLCREMSVSIRIFILYSTSKRCYIAFDFYTKLTSTAESSDNDKTYVFPDEKHHHSRRLTLPFRGSIVPDKFLCLRSQRNSQLSFPEPRLSGRVDTWMVRPANDSDCTITDCGSHVKRVLTRRFFVLSRLSLCTLFCLHERATICTCMPRCAKICASSRSDLMTFCDRIH